MNSTYSRLLLQWSRVLAKTHCCKLTRTYYRSFQQFNLPCIRSVKYFSNETETNNELNDEFDFFEEEEKKIFQPDYAAVAGDDPERLKMLKLCELEVNVLVEQGGRVPSEMKTEYWRELLKTTTKSQRWQYLNFLWLNEIKRKNHKMKKERKRMQFLEAIEQRIKVPSNEVTTSSPIRYGLTDISLFNRIQERTISKLYNYKLLQAMMFGPQIIVDSGFEQYMTRKEVSLLAKQVLLMWSENRLHCNPFDILFCNLDENSLVLQKMKKVIPNITEDPSFPFNYTSKDYLDLYPKERLVYLTPHCTETLNSFDGNDVYIIGAIVDKTNCEPLSLAKAKRDGIRVAKFPIDNHLNWGMGIKSLTLNQCVSIMNDLKDRNDWNYAFRHVPKRKLVKDSLINNAMKEKKITKTTVKSIKETYKRNMVYDILLNTKKTINWTKKEEKCD